MVQIGMLGPLRVSAHGRVLGPGDFGGVKPKQLLEVVALARGQAVTKDQIAEALWPVDLPRNHLATIETYASVLRGHLASGGAVASRSEVLVTEPGAYRLAKGAVHLDLDRLEVLRAAAAPPGAIAALREAAALVRGELLADEPYADWARHDRDRYRRLSVGVLLDLSGLLLASGQAEEAMAEAERAVGLDPLDEAGYRQVMQSAIGLDRRGDAVRAYRRCRDMLAEFNASPSPLTERVHRSIWERGSGSCSPAGQLPLSWCVHRCPARGGVPATAVPLERRRAPR